MYDPHHQELLHVELLHVELHLEDHRHVDRAVTEGLTDGLTRLAVDGKGRILGAAVVGPRAGETLGELAIAVRRGLRTRGGRLRVFGLLEEPSMLTNLELKASFFYL